MPMSSMKSMPTSSHDAAMTSALGPSAMSRDGFGTLRQPEATPIGGLHSMRGERSVMAHGFVNAIDDRR